MSAMLEFTSVSKDFSKTKALDRLDLAVEEGELYGLLGPNGAGKSTCMRLAATLLQPTSGTIRIGGRDAHEFRDEVRRLIGIVPQELGLIPLLTARENLEMFGRFQGLRGQELRKRVNEALALSELTTKGGPARDFSGGMKRRLNFTVGLLHQPALLLLDEPTVGVDPQSRALMFSTIRDLHAQGMTIVITSHQMDEIQSLCPRVGIIDNGRLVIEGSTSALVAEYGSTVTTIQTESCPELLASALEQVLGAGTVTVEENVVTLSVRNWANVAPDVFHVIARVEATVISIWSQPPTLDGVFLALTGRALRDSSGGVP